MTRAILFSCIRRKEVFFTYLLFPRPSAHKMLLRKKPSAPRKKLMCDEIKEIKVFIYLANAWFECTYQAISNKLSLIHFPSSY